jgi:hypothetical protein
METRYGMAQRIWVMDRGMTSAANLAWLRETGRRYLVGTPKSELRRWAPQLAAAQDWSTVREGVDAKRCPNIEGTETVVLIRSRERRTPGEPTTPGTSARSVDTTTRVARAVSDNDSASRQPRVAPGGAAVLAMWQTHHLRVGTHVSPQIGIGGC